MLDLSIFNTFETPADKKQSPWRLLLGRSASFNATLFQVVWHCRGLCLKGRFPDSVYFSQSDRIHDNLERHGARFRIEGLENIRTDEPCVYVANHMSLLETMVLPWIIGSFKPLSIVMKNSLYDSWIFNPIAETTKSISLTRKNLKADIDAIMSEGVEYLKKGRSVLLFPEGTRRKSFDRKAFNSLGVKLAARAGAKVQPIALKTDFLESGKIVSYAGSIHPERTVHFCVGEALEIEGRGKKEHNLILDFMEEKLSSWGVEIEGGEA